MSPRRPLLLALLLACETPAPVPAPVDAGPPPPPSRLETLQKKAETADDAGSWRAYADELAKVGRPAEAVTAYARCALAAGDDFEASLYCQAAAAVAKKVKRPLDGGMSSP